MKHKICGVVKQYKQYQKLAYTVGPKFVKFVTWEKLKALFSMYMILG